MPDPSHDRICTRCHTQFTPHHDVGDTCGAAFVVVIAALVIEALVKPGLLLLISMGLASALTGARMLRWFAERRERTCTACGSRQSVPVLSPVGVDLHARAARSLTMKPPTSFPS